MNINTMTFYLRLKILNNMKYILAHKLSDISVVITMKFLPLTVEEAFLVNYSWEDKSVRCNCIGPAMG
jgi:hypothetical protein